jgi:hypothetical protein
MHKRASMQDFLHMGFTGWASLENLVKAWFLQIMEDEGQPMKVRLCVYTN